MGSKAAVTAPSRLSVQEQLVAVYAIVDELDEVTGRLRTQIDRLVDGGAGHKTPLSHGEPT